MGGETACGPLYRKEHPNAILGQRQYCAKKDLTGLGKPVRSLKMTSRQEIAQLAAAAGVAQPSQRLGFDLPDSLAGDAELLSDFF